VERPIFFR